MPSPPFVRTLLTVLAVTLAPGAIDAAEKIHAPTLDAARSRVSTLLQTGSSFEVEVTGLVLKVGDAPAVLGLVRDATSLPVRSEVQFQGTMEGRPFKVTLERDRDQRLKLELRGVSIGDNRPMLELLDHLVDKRAVKVKLDYLLGDRRVELEFEESAAPPVADQREWLKQRPPSPQRGLGVR